jgi:hypothetical protein
MHIPSTQVGTKSRVILEESCMIHTHLEFISFIFASNTIPLLAIPLGSHFVVVDLVDPAALKAG